MKAGEIVRYCRDLGWCDPPELAPPPRPTPPPRAEKEAVAPSAAAGHGAAVSYPSLGELAAAVADCQRCRLARSRKRIVFGEGDERAALMLVGEAPAGEEEKSGRPFVGQAGQLLDAMILALGLERRQVYIANLLKCRPPGSRDPQADETDTCGELLDRQIELIRPAVLVALGGPAADRLCGTSKPISAGHGQWSSYRGTPLLATFHPAHLLQSPEDKALAWHDLKKVRERLRQPVGKSTSIG